MHRFKNTDTVQQWLLLNEFKKTWNHKTKLEEMKKIDRIFVCFNCHFIFLGMQYLEPDNRNL